MSLVVLGYIAAAVSLVGIILNAQKLMACWPVWIFSNFLWITYSGIQGDVPYIILWSVFTLSNVYGWVQWRKTRDRFLSARSGGKYNYKNPEPDFPARKNGKILRRK